MTIHIIKVNNEYNIKYALPERIKIFFGFKPRYIYKNGSITFNKPLKNSETYTISFTQ